jgi:hypothetical protein
MPVTMANGDKGCQSVTLDMHPAADLHGDWVAGNPSPYGPERHAGNPCRLGGASQSADRRSKNDGGHGSASGVLSSAMVTPSSD